MDPTLAFRQAFTVMDADLRALDLMGYEFTSVSPVPLPAAWWGMAAALSILAGVGRQRATPTWPAPA